MSRGWLGVVSAAHVRRGVELGIAQINHGKRAPLARMQPGDTLVYYSPSQQHGDRTRYQCFTAIGTVADDEIWQAEEGDFTPYRRRIDYLAATSVPLADLRPRLHLTENPNWGYQLRCGFVSLDAHDVQIIEEAMCA